jgi:hypothetical protein|tara:strand:+ start:9848 stop:10126 length:279 start_codon:yes stop_codon:yes gene_type:complete
MRKICVIVKTSDTYRQSEAVRVALGLTMLDDKVDLIVLDQNLIRNDTINTNLELLITMDGATYSNKSENHFDPLSLEDISGKLIEYDVVVAY